MEFRFVFKPPAHPQHVVGTAAVVFGIKHHHHQPVPGKFALHDHAASRRRRKARFLQSHLPTGIPDQTIRRLHMKFLHPGINHRDGRRRSPTDHLMLMSCSRKIPQIPGGRHIVVGEPRRIREVTRVHSQFRRLRIHRRHKGLHAPRIRARQHMRRPVVRTHKGRPQRRFTRQDHAAL